MFNHDGTEIEDPTSEVSGISEGSNTDTDSDADADADDERNETTAPVFDKIEEEEEEEGNDLQANLIDFIRETTQKQCESTEDQFVTSEIEAAASDINKDCILVHLNKESMEFDTFCDIGIKWEQLPSTGLKVPYDTERFNEISMIAANNRILIFHISNSVISRVHYVNVVNFTIEDVPVPKHIEDLGSAIFCQLNDEIFCFGRSEKQSFHK